MHFRNCFPVICYPINVNKVNRLANILGTKNLLFDYFWCLDLNEKRLMAAFKLKKKMRSGKSIVLEEWYGWKLFVYQTNLHLAANTIWLKRFSTIYNPWQSSMKNTSLVSPVCYVASGPPKSGSFIFHRINLTHKEHKKLSNHLILCVQQLTFMEKVLSIRASLWVPMAIFNNKKIVALKTNIKNNSEKAPKLEI